MEITDHITHLQREGEKLADAAQRAGFEARVPTCPDWTVRDLVQHIGGVHRWAATIVRERRSEDMSDEEQARVMAPPDDDAVLLDWYREGHAALVSTLSAAPSDVQCWYFLSAPTPLAFWARRQAHETAIHRADAESAGAGITPLPADLAADGIDELLTCFVVRARGRLRAPEPRTLHVHCTDTEGEWLVRIGPESVETTREHAKGDCALRGTASDLQLLLWNRRDAEGLDVLGDPSLLDLWRERARIRWA